MSLADELLADLEEAGLEGEATIDEAEEGDIEEIDEIEDVGDMDTGQSGIDPDSIQSVARCVKSAVVLIVHLCSISWLFYRIPNICTVSCCPLCVLLVQSVCSFIKIAHSFNMA